MCVCVCGGYKSCVGVVRGGGKTPAYAVRPPPRVKQKMAHTKNTVTHSLTHSLTYGSDPFAWFSQPGK